MKIIIILLISFFSISCSSPEHRTYKRLIGGATKQELSMLKLDN